jgi:outer membrane protein TolC
MMRAIAPLLALGLLIGGCSSYTAAHLPEAPSFPVGLSKVGQGEALPGHGPTAGHPFDARDGLDFTEVATLAVVNNPDLRIARLAARLTAAQSFAAGLLPDPQINLSRDLPEVVLTGGSSAFVAGIGYAINALVTHSSIKEAGDQDTVQADLNLLWQEWQVIAQARLQFVRLQAAAERKALLMRTHDVVADRYRRAGAALAAGLLTIDAVAPQLAALQDVERQLHDLERQTNQARFDLVALLGLAPDTPLVLQGNVSLPPADAAALETGLAARLNTRPDLRALRAGYAAQDARYRVALLQQFPALTFGVQRSRDTSNVYTRGFAINLGLPVFNGNRGEVRVQDATRDKLRAEYQQRLNAGSLDIHRALAEHAISTRQLADTEAALVALRSATARLRTAFDAHNIDALALATLELSTLAKESERLDALQALQEQRIGLLTLAGPTGDDLLPPSSYRTPSRTERTPSP